MWPEDESAAYIAFSRLPEKDPALQMHLAVRQLLMQICPALRTGHAR